MLYLCIAQVVPVDDILPGDMILLGDAGMGLPMFRLVESVYEDGPNVTLVFEGEPYQHVIVKPTTEVVRLEQGNNPFSDGTGGVRTRSADIN